MSLETKIEMLLNPSMEFTISEYALDDLLQGDPNDSGEYWDLNSEGLADFAKKISKLYVVSNGGFSFQALWAGEQATEVKNVSINEFIETLHCNQISKKCKYMVVGSL